MYRMIPTTGPTDVGEKKMERRIPRGIVSLQHTIDRPKYLLNDVPSPPNVVPANRM
jgi:hypothetical protein